MAIQLAESTKVKRPSKVLAHIEIHPQLGGGHVIKHVYSSYQHESKEVKFNADGKSQGDEHIQDHLAKHAGLSAMEGHEDGKGGETEQEEG